MSKSTPATTKALEQARARLEDQLATNPEDPKLLVLLARATEKLGRHEEAGLLFMRGAKASRVAGDRAQEATTLLECAQAFARAGQAAKAKGFFQRAVAGHELLGDTQELVKARLAMGRFLVATGAGAEARQVLARCTTPLEKALAWDDLGWVHERLAALLRDAGDLGPALEHAKDAVRCAANAQDRRLFGGRVSEVARLHHQLGHIGKARSYEKKALAHLRDPEQRDALMRALDHLRELALADDDPVDAERWATEAVTLADRGLDPAEQGAARVRLAAVLHRLGKDDEISDLLARAEALYTAAGDAAGAKEVAAARGAAAAGAWRPT